ncbi:MAG: thioredoxin family protein [Proteobacteria bacterium]|nr:thioredoxin family protein [Pseudomonadota bacterium]
MDAAPEIESSPDAGPSQLPANGLVAFVKRDCPTCELVGPVLAELAAAAKTSASPLTVYSQDDPSFPEGLHPRDDRELAASWRNKIETVPTLLRLDDGRETGRVVGWHRAEWQELTGVTRLGEALPDSRPGCGSLSVDPARESQLRARFESGRLSARRVQLAELEDEFELAHERGWSDGLPVVPPTERRVLDMLEGTERDPAEIVATVPPDLVDCTVEKVAINAVMAGCRPEYLPVVLAAVEAVCSDEFNMHGVLATTMGVGPVLIVNGPLRRRINMNSGVNVLGQGNRANATIGRALQLVIRNVGGGRPDGVDRATYGNPGKLGLCFAEGEEDSPWQSLAVDRGFDPSANTVTVFTGEAPRTVVDQLSREPGSLARSLAAGLMGVLHPKLGFFMDAMLVIGPEHARVFADAGWGKQQLIDRLHELTTVPASEMSRGTGGIEEGLPLPAEMADQPVGKFVPGALHLVFAGGGAGLFSVVIGGWLNGDAGSRMTTREIGR